MNTYIVTIYRNEDFFETFELQCLNMEDAVKESNIAVEKIQTKDTESTYRATIELEGFIKHT